MTDTPNLIDAFSQRLKMVTVVYTVDIATDEPETATELANSIAEFMVGSASSHSSKGVAAVERVRHSVGLPVPAAQFEPQV